MKKSFVALSVVMMTLSVPGFASEGYSETVCIEEPGPIECSTRDYYNFVMRVCEVQYRAELKDGRKETKTIFGSGRRSTVIADKHDAVFSGATFGVYAVVKYFKTDREMMAAADEGIRAELQRVSRFPRCSDRKTAEVDTAAALKRVESVVAAVRNGTNPSQQEQARKVTQIKYGKDGQTPAPSGETADNHSAVTAR